VAWASISAERWQKRARISSSPAAIGDPEAVPSEIEALGRRVLPLSLDVRDHTSIRAHGGGGHWRTTAGLTSSSTMPGCNVRKPALEVTWEDWNLILDTNLRAPSSCPRQLPRTWYQRKYGRIINIGSVTCVAGLCRLGPYGASRRWRETTHDEPRRRLGYSRHHRELPRAGAGSRPRKTRSSTRIRSGWNTSATASRSNDLASRGNLEGAVRLSSVRRQSSMSPARRSWWTGHLDWCHPGATQEAARGQAVRPLDTKQKSDRAARDSSTASHILRKLGARRDRVPPAVGRFTGRAQPSIGPVPYDRADRTRTLLQTAEPRHSATALPGSSRVPIISRHAGYSPDDRAGTVERQLTRHRNLERQLDLRETFPTSVTSPPLRTQRIARSTVAATPTASKATSASLPIGEPADFLQRAPIALLTVLSRPDSSPKRASPGSCPQQSPARIPQAVRSAPGQARSSPRPPLPLCHSDSTASCGGRVKGD